MPLESRFSAVVLLVGADAAALESLQPAAEVLASFGIETEESVDVTDGSTAPFPDGLCAVIVASPDAALPAALSARTVLPVIRVPLASAGFGGLALLVDGDDNLPAGPAPAVFATMSIGPAGAKNAALFVVSSLATQDKRLQVAWAEFRRRQTVAVLAHPPLNLEGEV